MIRQDKSISQVVMSPREEHSKKPDIIRDKIKRCKHCKRPIRETVGKSGYCKKCIKLAKGG